MHPQAMCCLERGPQRITRSRWTIRCQMPTKHWPAFTWPNGISQGQRRNSGELSSLIRMTLARIRATEVSYRISEGSTRRCPRREKQLSSIPFTLRTELSSETFSTTGATMTRPSGSTTRSWTWIPIIGWPTALWPLPMGKSEMYPQALAELQKVMAAFPHSNATAVLGQLKALSGAKDEARKIARELQQSSKKEYASDYWVATIYAALGDNNQAFQLLENAYTERSQWLIQLKVDPRFANLRSDRRFSDLLRRIGLPT